MDKILLISDAAKEVKVESHVLRYWEDELKLPIKRNELGHRYYTMEDVNRFKQIKIMKDQGLQLKAIKMILKDGKLDVVSLEDSAGNFTQTKAVQVETSISKENAGEVTMNEKPETIERKDEAIVPENASDKAKRLQWLLQQLIRETLQENNRELCREIREGIVKELDYQFRVQEEREEARDRRQNERSDEYYKKMDELLRTKSAGRSIKNRKAESIPEKTSENKEEESAASKTIDLKTHKRKKQKRKFFFS